MKNRIHLDDVVLRYRLIHERPDSLREAFAKIFRKRSQVMQLEAASHVSLDVSDGEILGIIGRNGCGKSTLLKIIAGVLKPTSGIARVDGSIAPLIELGAGFHPDLTGRENIVLNGLLLGLTRKKIREYEQNIIEYSELGDFINSPVKQYSSGMYMRLAFSIAIQVDPDILLVDEILSVGDAEFHAKCDESIAGFHRRNKTIVLVSHELETVARMCNRVLLMEAGRVVADGPAEQVIQEYYSRMNNHAPAEYCLPVPSGPTSTAGND
ncbi:MAG TPA: ABC transporter ATP-binding protein [Terriglobales bacterium]|nr:ABC transporter ATP-binding protein [Terriglobales bacterium]